MDRADIKLGFLFAYFLAAALHSGLAFIILRRRVRLGEIRIFAGANLALSAWHVLQLIEYALLLADRRIPQSLDRGLSAAQLLVASVILLLFFQLFATFERVYRRRAPSLRAAITAHVHRHRREYIPLSYLTVIAGGAVYLLDAGQVLRVLADLRASIGPTSAYLSGGAILFTTFVLFPARPGQERAVVPALGRGLLMLSLAFTLLFIALWHDSHPQRTSMVLLPLLHLHSVAFAVFFALVRYEFSFMDRYILDGLKLLAWSAISLLAYFAFNRIQIEGGAWARYANSLARVGVLLAAVAIGAGIHRMTRPWVDRVLFDRDSDLAKGVHLFAERLASAGSLESLLEGASRDIGRAVHAKRVKILRGNDEPQRNIARRRFDGEHRYRLSVPMVSRGNVVGWILLGDRRNVYPYFDAERRFLHLVGELLGGAIVAIGGGRAVPRRSEDTRDLKKSYDELLQRHQRLERELKQTRRDVRALRERLDPELVAEVLTIAEEVSSRDLESAVGILSTLREAYGYMLVGGSAPVSLGEEMAFAQSYLAMEKLRTHNRLEVSLGYDTALRDQEVPRRLLQPLIENALLHGLSRELRSGHIGIHATRHEQRCRIVVEDNGRGYAGDFHQECLSGEGGLARVHGWLVDRFGEDIALHIESPAGDGTRLSLDFPRRDLDRNRRSVA